MGSQVKILAGRDRSPDGPKEEEYQIENLLLLLLQTVVLLPW